MPSQADLYVQAGLRRPSPEAIAARRVEVLSAVEKALPKEIRRVRSKSRFERVGGRLRRRSPGVLRIARQSAWNQLLMWGAS